MTGPQISEWEAFNTIDPIGSWRDDFRIAKFESLIANIVNILYSKKGHQPKITTPMDFMIAWGEDNSPEEVEKQSVESLKQFLIDFTKDHNKRVAQANRNRTKPPVRKRNKQKP